MIIPVFLKPFHQSHFRINDNLFLVNENGDINVYNVLREDVGFLSTKTLKNTKLNNFLKDNIVNGRVWAIFKNKLLVELTNK